MNNKVEADGWVKYMFNQIEAMPHEEVGEMTIEEMVKMCKLRIISAVAEVSCWVSDSELTRAEREMRKAFTVIEAIQKKFEALE